MRYKTMARQLIVDRLGKIMPSAEDGPFLRNDGKEFTDSQLSKLNESLQAEIGRITARFKDIQQ